MSTPFRLAFIGIDHPHGSGWRDLLPNLGADVELVALVPAFGGALCSLEEKYAHLPRYATVSELVAQATFDGAIVCLPDRDTPAVAIALAQAGKHLLLEKPGAMNASGFQPVVDAVQRHGVAFQTGYLWRYDRGAERLQAMVRDGRFGRLISIEAGLFTSDVSRRGPAHFLFDREQSGGGFFQWLMCHWLDLIAFIFEEPIVSVFAHVGRFGGTEIAVEDGGTAMMELAGGALITLTGGYWLPRWAGESHWRIRGTQRWLHWEPSKPNTGGVFTIFGPQPQFMAMNETFTLPEDKTPGYAGQRGVDLLRDWLTMARTGIPCRNTIESALQTLRWLGTIYESSQRGCQVRMDIAGQPN